jgi:hypothetical protein
LDFPFSFGRFDFLLTASPIAVTVANSTAITIWPHHTDKNGKYH